MVSREEENINSRKQELSLFADSVASFPISRPSLNCFIERFYKLNASHPSPQFASLDIVLNKFSAQKGTTCQPEFFDNVRQQTADKDPTILADILHRFATAEPRPAMPFLEACRGWVQKHAKDFGRKELAALQPVLSKDYYHLRINQTYAKIAEDLSQNYNRNLTDEISSLNNWAFRHQGKGLLNNLALRSTYINLLYERIVRDHSIKDFYPWQYAKKQKQTFKEEADLITGQFDKKSEKIICYPHALNKIYKLISNRDNFNLDACRTALQQFSGSPFYNDCQTILQAIDGGSKNRNVKLPRQTSFCHD